MPYYEWDEKKRRENIAKHGWDFSDADVVYEHANPLVLASPQHEEARVKAIAAVGVECLVTLTLVYVMRMEKVRVISLRPASRLERRVYHEWQHRELFK